MFADADNDLKLWIGQIKIRMGFGIKAKERLGLGQIRKVTITSPQM